MGRHKSPPMAMFDGAKQGACQQHKRLSVFPWFRLFFGRFRPVECAEGPGDA